MATQLSKLQDRAAAVAAMLADLSAVEDRSAEQAAEMEKLAAEGERLEAELAREHSIAERITSLRGKVAATAKPVEVAAVEPVARPSRDSGKATMFRSSSDAEACGRWIRGYVLGRAEDRSWYEKHVEARALSPSDNSKGGVFIPDTFASTVIRLVESYGAFPAQANNLTMASDTLYIPRRTAGNTAYHTGANSETTVTDMATDNVLLSSKEVRVGTRVPNQLIDDSAIDLAGLVAQEFALAIALRIDEDGFIGTGASTYGGIRGIQWKFENETLTAGIHDSSQTAVTALTIDDFANTIAKLPTYASQSPTCGWYTTPQMHALANLGRWRRQQRRSGRGPHPLTQAPQGTLNREPSPELSFRGRPVGRCGSELGQHADGRHRHARLRLAVCGRGLPLDRQHGGPERGHAEALRHGRQLRHDRQPDPEHGLHAVRRRQHGDGQRQPVRGQHEDLEAVRAGCGDAERERDQQREQQHGGGGGSSGSRRVWRRFGVGRERHQPRGPWLSSSTTRRRLPWARLLHPSPASSRLC